jgi:hypothetical protein
MKSEITGPPRERAGRGRRSPMRIPQIPMEWMDPMSWRLPSGKALAEFALQTGFLAPLMLGTPLANRKRTTKVPPEGPGAEVKQAEEASDHDGSFRETR